MNKEINLATGSRLITDADIPSAPAPLQLRLADPGDIEAIAGLEERAFDPALYGGSIMSRRSIRNFITRANALLLLAEKDHAVVGYALILFRRTSQHARFYSLAVDPACQGGGVGSALFQAVEDVSRQAGAAELLLEIREDNEILQNRYAKKGYEPYRLVPDYYGDGAGALKMRRALS